MQHSFCVFFEQPLGDYSAGEKILITVVCKQAIPRSFYTRRHKYEKELPSLGKEGQPWRKPARGGWNLRGTHHPSHGLRL